MLKMIVISLLKIENFIWKVFGFGFDGLLFLSNSSTAQEIITTIDDLQEYIKGGKDNLHSQLREGYGHIPKPQARKISTYLESILHDAYKYSNDRKRGRKPSK